MKSLKSIKFLALLFTLAIFFFATVTTNAQRRKSKRPSLSNRSQSSGEQEAAKFWSKYVASCSGSRYVKNAPSIFVELKGFRLQMNYDSITEADRLNGVEAKGQSGFTATSHRFYSRSAWHAWGNGMPADMQLTNSVKFQKRRGEWKFYGVGYFNDYAKPVTCSDIPGFETKQKNETPTNTIQISDTHVFPIEYFTIWNSNTNENGSRFAQSTTTFINWKIYYTQTAFDYTPPQTQSYWYKDGVQWSYSDSANFSNASKGQLWTGKGWAEPGKWEIGKYTIKIYVRKQLVKIGTFEIVSDSELPQTLRFDGLYKSSDSDNKSDYLRFYEDGRVLLGYSIPNNTKLYRLGICVGFNRSKYAEGCGDFGYRQGRYTVSGNNIYFSYDDDSGGVPVSVTGTIGNNMLKLNYDVGPGTLYNNLTSTFINVGRLY